MPVRFFTLNGNNYSVTPYRSPQEKHNKKNDKLEINEQKINLKEIFICWRSTCFCRISASKLT